MKVAYSPIYKYDLPEGHRFPMIKYELIPEQLIYEGTLSKDQFFHPDRLSDDEILLTHSEAYLHKLMTDTLSYKEARAIGFPIRAELIERGRHISMGTYQCALYALENNIGLNIAGGTHHSFKDRGEGFCILNDFAIASNLLLHRKQVDKILIVDLDVHQGNGTASIFRNEDRVFTFSMHGAKNYPVRKEASDLDIGLPDGTRDDAYLQTLFETLPGLLDREEPDIVFYLSGVDVLASDKLGRLALTKEGCRTRDAFVFQECEKRKIPVTVSMGGGYSVHIKDIVEAHANTYRMAAEIFY